MRKPRRPRIPGKATSSLEDVLDDFLCREGGTILVNLWEELAETSDRMAEVMAELARTRRRSMKILRLALADNREWARKHRVHGSPAILVFRDGRLVGCYRGCIDLAALLEELERLGL